MNEQVRLNINKITEFWKTRSSNQKVMMIGSLLLLITFVVVVSMASSKVTFAPLYSNLSAGEVGEVKAQLDGRGIKTEIADNGTTILVPKEVVDTLKVELAAEGYPTSGSIDYSFFSQNAGFGMTDNEFNVLKLDAMQSELANLIKGIEGVNDAKVMINLPQESVWMSDTTQEASASIVLNTKPGYRFEPQQIQALYNLVSKSVPNLPTSNIVIMNQMFEYFDLQNKNNINLTDPAYAFQTQHAIKQEIERDIQRQVQQMLGMMMGQNKVVVSVTTDIDFTQENREENLVTPVNTENMEGIAISVERITETFTGDGSIQGGIDGSGETDIPNYATGGEGGTGDYERIEERINNDVNRIRKEIVESPYKVRDLGIQVMVEPPISDDETSLPQQSIDDIEQILSTIIRTSIAKQDGMPELTNEDIASKVAVSVQTFNGKTIFETPEKELIPFWTYLAGAGLLIIILLLLFLLFRKKKENVKDKEELVQDQYTAASVQDIHDEKESESDLIKTQLEKLAKDNPGDFAKLLRSWIAEE